MRRRASVGLLALLLLPEGSVAAPKPPAAPPLHAVPPTRYDRWVSIEPRRWPRPPVAAAIQPPSPPVASGPPPADCVADLAKKGITARRGVAPPPGNEACTIADPVNLMSVTTEPGRSIRVVGEPLISCGMAARFGDFLHDTAAPLLKGALGSPAVSIEVGGGFECRTRNHVAGAKPSAHGLGIAVDIAGFTLQDGRKLMVVKQDTDVSSAAFQGLRVAACGYFTTVLGPGSDPFHATHMHVDILQHGASDRYRICQ